jgi:hypothetical protein
MRTLAAWFRPDRRRVVVALALASLIYLGFLGTYAFADDKSHLPWIYRWLMPLTVVAWPAWLMLFWPLASLSKLTLGSDDWVWAMGSNPSGLMFSYLVGSLVVTAFDWLRARIARGLGAIRRS